MLDLMSENKILITGKLNPSEGTEKLKSLWEELTILLNSAGYGPAKSVEGWKKVHTELYLLHIIIYLH